MRPIEESASGSRTCKECAFADRTMEFDQRLRCSVFRKSKWAEPLESTVDSCQKEHKAQANKYLEPIKEWTIDTRNWHRLVQGVAKFDWTKVREIPIEKAIDSWWSTVEVEFTDRCKEYEEMYLESRMKWLAERWLMKLFSFSPSSTAAQNAFCWQIQLVRPLFNQYLAKLGASTF